MYEVVYLRLSRTVVVIFFCIFLFVATRIYTKTKDTFTINWGSPRFPLQKLIQTNDLKCAFPPPSLPPDRDGDPNLVCPQYMRWIHEDLKPWKGTGITRDMVERKKADFRLAIVNGRAYLKQYRKAYQTRDLLTIWGILQLLRRYPGRIPDLDLMFDCGDLPIVVASQYQPFRGPNGAKLARPHPVFGYCNNDQTRDIVFPDWSFWGWPELNIKPWEQTLKDIKEENKKMRWEDREPYAYWKGNRFTGKIRKELASCNVSSKHDWNARIFDVNWGAEFEKGLREANLAKECTYKYKIYVEGRSWSVSEKYILACDSPTLLITPKYYDFFTRGMKPAKHYWPVGTKDKCRSIKFAVDWGNQHKDKAKAIGKVGSKFIYEMLKMDNVYDYMYHLLSEYSKLLKYKPTIPRNATEICSETMLHGREGLEKKFMLDSMVNFSRPAGPCLLPPPFEPLELKAFMDKKANMIKQVQKLEKQA